MPTAKRKTPTVKEQLTKGLQDIEQRMESMFRDSDPRFYFKYFKRRS